MKILVAIKRVVDYAAQIRVKSDESGIELANVKMSMNPFDEIAVEEAVRLKEKKIASEVIVVSIGSTASMETIRTALAIGADRGILIEANPDIQTLAAAKILKEIALKEGVQLIILGKQAIDTDNNQTGQMLAGFLGWSQGTFASKLIVEGDTCLVTREIDGGLETLRLQLPSVITTDLRLNEPRYLSLPNIMQAKRKPIQTIPLADLNVNAEPRIKIVKTSGVKKRHTGIKVSSVKELISKLKNEAQVI